MNQKNQRGHAPAPKLSPCRNGYHTAEITQANGEPALSLLAGWERHGRWMLREYWRMGEVRYLSAFAVHLLAMRRRVIEAINQRAS